MSLFPWFLFAHVLGAIAAFGPTFSSSIIGKMGGAEPQHANFATRVNHALANQRILPLAVLQGITGVGLIITGNRDLTKSPWLLIAIVLYAIALGFAFSVQVPTVKKIIAITSTPPPTPAPGMPAGPPPELRALIERTKRGGLVLASLVAVIVFLLVVKPF